MQRSDYGGIFITYNATNYWGASMSVPFFSSRKYKVISVGAYFTTISHVTFPGVLIYTMHSVRALLNRRPTSAFSSSSRFLRILYRVIITDTS